MLEKHPLRQHATEEDFELEIFVSLGLMERKQQQRRSANRDMSMEEVYKLEEKEEITRQFEHDQFLEHIGLSDKQAQSTKNIAIIGEPGAGKSTLLEKLAKEIDEQNKGLPICISLANLNGICLANQDGLTIEEYLKQKWLKNALPIIHDIAPQALTPDWQVSENIISALVQEFTKTQEGGVWLLLDGLDEMKATSPTEALTIIEKQIASGYLAKARVILSCRTNVWDANLTNPFSKFDIYKTLEFEDSQRDDFIQCWFNKSKKPQLGTDLIAKLTETGKERIRELVKNPLRLVLLCRIWTLNQGQLPETKAEFYQRYLLYFYNWKKNIRDLTRQLGKRTELHKALGNLAIKAIKSGSRYRFKESLGCNKMGEELFRLAEALGWLNIVDRDLATEEAVYAFFHPTFQEYFAALAINDWDFFLPRDHVDKPVEGKEYRIFEPKWKEVILLWLGREDIAKEEKEEFINTLVNFKDWCNSIIFRFIPKKRRFYQYQAYFLAAAGINEFKEFSRTKEIVKQVVDWSFGKLIENIKSSAKTALIETNRTEAINTLEEFLNSNANEDNHKIIKIARFIGKIDSKNKTANNILEKEFYNSMKRSISIVQDNIPRGLVGESDIIQSKDIKKIVGLNKIYDLLNDDKKNIITTVFLAKFPIETCIKIIENYSSYNEAILFFSIFFLRTATKNQKAIAALIKLISSSTYEYIICQAVIILGKIAFGNVEGITTLIKLINSTNNEYLVYQAAETLSKIDLENQIAITVLLKLINSATDNDIRIFAIESLRNINSGNEETFAVLIDLINSSTDEWIRREAATSLRNIEPKNETAIAVLVDLIKSSSDKYTLMQAAESLAKSLTKPLMLKVVNSLKNTANESAIMVLWYCAQNLSYPEFYTAWHN